MGQITHEENETWTVKFTKYTDESFIWPNIDDTDVVTNDDIIRILPKPLITRRGLLKFENIKFDRFNIK